MTQAVLFDFDGTVVNSLKHIHPVWKQALMKQGVDLSDEEIIRDVYYATNEERAQRYGLDEDRLHRDFRTLIEQVHQDYELYEQVDDVLVELKARGTRTAIVTMGHAEQVGNILKRLGIAELFEVMLGGKDAGRPKPHPDIALKAMELLGVSKEGTVLVGDSLVDMQTGRSAGIRVGLFMPPVNAAYSNTQLLTAAKPDFIFAHFSELLGKIDTLG